MRILVDKTPSHWLTGLQIVRILALGALLKAAQDQFPVLFAWTVGVPDLMFGISAIVVTWLARQGRLKDRFLHTLAFARRAGHPGADAGFMPLFTRESLFVKLFAFPMVFALAVVVPTLVMLNMLVTWRLWE